MSTWCSNQLSYLPLTTSIAAQTAFDQTIAQSPATRDQQIQRREQDEHGRSTQVPGAAVPGDAHDPGHGDQCPEEGDQPGSAELGGSGPMLANRVHALPALRAPPPEPVTTPAVLSADRGFRAP